MVAKVVADKYGRVVIPRRIAKEVGIDPGKEVIVVPTARMYITIETLKLMTIKENMRIDAGR